MTKLFHAFIIFMTLAVFVGLSGHFTSIFSPEDRFRDTPQVSFMNENSQDDGYYIIPEGYAENFSLGGYASKRSVIQGETVDLHISTDVSVYQISIWREGATRNLMKTVYDIKGEQIDCAGLYAVGCDWPVAYTLEIPES